MDLPQLLSLTGASALVAMLVEVEKRTLNISGETLDRFGPLMAIATGLAVTVPVSVYLAADVAQAALTGLLAGLTAIGIYKATSTSAAG